MNKNLGTTRDGFGKALIEIGTKNAQAIVLCADLTDSMRANWFKEEFPKRFLEMGVQEENMVGVATGLSLEGKIPFACSYSTFLINNALGPIRSSVCYSNANVKLIGGHAGITTGPDGATHQALEDIATMRVLPNMTVIVPADQEEARQATHAISKMIGPCYLRIGKYEVPNSTNPDNKFEIGKAKMIHEGPDITIVTCGNLVHIAKEVAESMCQGKDGHRDICIDVINMHTIKPIDKETLLKSLKKTRALITFEEHQIAGGLGSAVLEVITTSDPELLSTPVIMMGINDSFGQSGSSSQLLEHYNLDHKSLEQAIIKVVSLKRRKEK